MPDHQLFMVDNGYHQIRTAQEHLKHDPFDAPTALICHPDGAADQATVVAFAGGISKHVRVNSQWFWHTEYALAPWLRGLYNSDPAAAGNAGDIVIGWWPRYASAQPKTPQAGSEAAYLRCRRYASAGFPIAMQNIRFDQVSEPAVVDVDNTAGEDLFYLEARASAKRDHDWARADLSPETTFTTFSASALRNVFSVNVFNGEVRGAELRVWWRYDVDQSSKLDSLAEASTKTPLIKSVRIRWQAPMALLSVENAQ
jgi:hypothetical protein